MKKNSSKSKVVKKKSALVAYDEEIKRLKNSYNGIDCMNIKNFKDFPLSSATLKALVESKFRVPTSIQLRSIGPALQGKDVLGAAITGSGKTLAYLIPILENLFIQKWSRADGIGAIIISPTRELSYQIFETLKKIGKYHDFSAALVIGGVNLRFERRRMDQVNILICTPGRLLQHMDENPLFNATTMKILVLDEADRCLDMGFKATLNAIIENLPPDRQTLLFSATQTNSVEDLARLKLNNPIKIGHTIKSTINKNDDDKTTTESVVPDLLQQNYVVLPLEEKITMLWSFIKNHLKHKIIVFLSTCKQVKYIYEIFCKLRPGISLLALYGTLHQDRRIAIYNDFIQKRHVILFATDIASRGLDFPSVNWVIQLDCPEDVTQYIHRAGRSARNKTSGDSLLVLTPSEQLPMMEELQKKSIQIEQIHIDPKKLFSPRAKIESYLAQNPELKATAQRAFQAYIKSVFLMHNKKIFNIESISFDSYANSLGLAITPRIKSLERYLNKKKGLLTKDNKNLEEEKIKGNLKKINLTTEYDTDSDDDDFIKIKRINHDVDGNCVDNAKLTHEEDLLMPIKREKLLTKAALAKKSIKKNLQVNMKRKFNEMGEAVVDTRTQLQSALGKDYTSEAGTSKAGGIDIRKAKQLLTEEDKYDKQRFRELVKERHKKTKEKIKRMRNRGYLSDDVDNYIEEYSNDESDDSSIDLSWLPNLDAISINKKETNTENTKDFDLVKHNVKNSSDDDSSVDDYDVEPMHKKIKVTKKLTLNDAELIAAKLLANKS